MIERLNKKGQGGLSFEMIVGVVILVISADLIIIYFYGFSEKAGALTAQDVDMLLLEQTCNRALAFGNTHYCVGTMETKTDNRFVGCKYADENLGLVVDSSNSPDGVVPTCEGDVEKQICLKIKTELSAADWAAEDIYINGEKCAKDVSPEEAAGGTSAEVAECPVPKDAELGCNAETGAQVMDGSFSNVGDGQICCSA